MPVTGAEPTINAYLRKGDGTLYKISGGGSTVPAIPDDQITVDVVPPVAPPSRDDLLWFVI